MTQIDDICCAYVTKMFAISSFVIIMLMSTLSWSLPFALRSGSAMYLLLAVLLSVDSNRLNRIYYGQEYLLSVVDPKSADIEETRKTIGKHIRLHLDEKAALAFFASCVMLALAIFTRLAS